MQVMLLAAGRSTRLGALGAMLPKPLIPICGYPAITYALALCRQAGLRDVVVNLHHHGGAVREALGDGARFGVDIRYSIEDELLGTGGGIRAARTLFRSEPVLVINAKVIADLDLRDVIAAHHAAPRGAQATLVLCEAPRDGQWSPVGVDATGHVVSLRGQRTDTTPVGPISQRVFTGIHVIDGAALDRLPPGLSDIVADAYIPALLDGQRIHSVMMEGFFADPSTPERYLEANLALLRQPELVAAPPGPLVGIEAGARVDPGARVEMPCRIAAGASIEAGAVVGPEVVVCADAHVAAGARLARSVVWPGATAGGERRDEVIALRDR